MKAFKYILALCLLFLIAHAGLVVVSERQSKTRWFMTEEGKAYFKKLGSTAYEPYADGGEAANSALVLNFSESTEPSTSEAYRSEVYFDYDGSGRAVQTGWIGPEAGLLLLADPSSSEDQPDGRSLFGNHSPVYDSNHVPVIEEAKGFAALSAYDANIDGRIDAQDPIWIQLRIWRDHDHNGVLDPGELYTLDELGLAALDLKAEKKGFFLPDHNYLAASAFFHYSDGRQGSLDEIYFQRMNANRKYADAENKAAVSDAFPNVKGRGLLMDLNDAAAGNPELRRLVEQFANTRSHDERVVLIDELLAAWAATGGMESDPAKRAGSPYRLIGNCLDSLTADQKKYLPLLDAWAGRYHYRLPNEKFPGQKDDSKIIGGGPEGFDLTVVCPEKYWAEFLTPTYMNLKSEIYFQLVQSSVLRPYLAMVGLSPDREATGLDQLMDSFDQYYDDNPRQAVFTLMEMRIVLAKEKVPSRLLGGLDEYIEDKLWNVVIDDEMDVMKKYMNKIIALTDAGDRKKRLARQWGQDSLRK